MPLLKTLITAVLTFLPTFGSAEAVCMPASEYKAALFDWYAEQMVRSDSQTGLVLWASERTGTWTLAAMRDDGTLCTVATGRYFIDGLADTTTLAGLLTHD